jgi:hypothetical protein
MNTPVLTIQHHHQFVLRKSIKIETVVHFFPFKVFVTKTKVLFLFNVFFFFSFDEMTSVYVLQILLSES